MDIDSINHPKHYQPIFPSVTAECILITRLLSFDRGNAFKYIWRAGEKGGHEKFKEDLEKALWYINDEQQNGKHNTAKVDLDVVFPVFNAITANADKASFKYQALRAIVTGDLKLAEGILGREYLKIIGISERQLD